MGDKPLSEREFRFVDAFMGPAKGVGAAACKSAGYKGNPKTLTTQAQRMLAKASIQREIAARRAALTRSAIATADEVAVRLSAVGLGMVKEARLITGKEGDFIEAEVTMPGTTQVSALKALIDLMGYAAPTKSEVTVQPTSPEVERALIEYLRLPADERAAFKAWREAQR